MAGLLAILILFFSFGHVSQPKCPALWPETMPKWVESTEWLKTAKGIPYKMENGEWVNITDATITISSTSSEMVQDGTTTDEAAVEYNKRVRECQTLNGEF